MNGSFTLTKPDNRPSSTLANNFFSEQIAVLLRDNYQTIYDCFFSIVKERQAKQNVLMSSETTKHNKKAKNLAAVAPATNIQDEKTKDYSENTIKRIGNEMIITKDYNNAEIIEVGKGSSQNQSSNNKKEDNSLGAYDDSLYLPSAFFKHKTDVQDINKKKPFEYEYRNLVSSLSSKFFDQICKNSPYLESIVADLDALNNMIQTNHISQQHYISQDSLKSPKINPLEIAKISKDGQTSQYALQITVKGEQPQVQVDRLEKKLKEHEKLQKRVKELDQITSKMRKDYYKDLINQKIVQRVPDKQKAKANQANNEDQIPVIYFDILAGVDSDILNMINQRLADMKERFDKRLAEHVKYQEILTKKIQNFNKLSPDAFSLINLSMSDILKGLSVIEQNPQVLWDEIHKHHGQDYFLFIIEKEYGTKFQKDYSQMNSDIDKIQDEASFQIKEVLNKSQKEIIDLRRIVDEKSQEMNQLKENQLKEIEKAQKDAYFNAEMQFRHIEAKNFNKSESDKQELYQKITQLEEVNTNFDTILVKSSMKFSLMKLSLMTQLHKVINYTNNTVALQNNSELGQMLTQTINRIFDIVQGRTSMEIDIVKREYENDLKNVMDENNAYSLEIQDRKLREQQANEKIQYLEQCLDDAHEEAQMYKSKVDSMHEENRKLAGEHNTLSRALQNSQKLCEGLEAEKARMEFEINKVAGNNVAKYQSALAEAELHRKKALNVISNTGANSLQTMYGSTKQTKGTMTYLKDVQCEVTLIKKNADGENIKMTNNQLQLREPKYTQTDTDIVVLTEIEFQQLQNGNGGNFVRSNSRMSRNSSVRQKINGVDSEKALLQRRFGDQHDTLNEHDEYPFDDDFKDAEIQCNIINVGNSPQRGLNDSMDYIWSNDMNVTIQDWNNKYMGGNLNLLGRSYQHLKFTDTLKMPNLKDLPEVYRRLYLDMFEKASRYEKIKIEFDRISNEQWQKKEIKRGAKKKSMIQKDPMTGKVFISLVELYKDATVQQLVNHSDSLSKSPVRKNTQPQNNLNDYKSSEMKRPSTALNHQNTGQSLNQTKKSENNDLTPKNLTVNEQENGITIGTQTESSSFNIKQMLQFNKVQQFSAANQSALSHYNSSGSQYLQQSAQSLSKTRYEQTRSSQGGSRKSHHNLLQNQYQQQVQSQDKNYSQSKEQFMVHQQRKQRRNLHESMVGQSAINHNNTNKYSMASLQTTFTAKNQQLSQDNYNTNQQNNPLNQSSDNLANLRKSNGARKNIFELPMSLVQSRGTNQHQNDLDLSQRLRSKHSSAANSTYRIYLNEPKVRISRQLNI